MSPGKSVLVVDDSRSQRVLMRELMAEAQPDGRFFALENGELAVEHLARCAAGNAPAVDIVVLDREMPRLDGFAVLEQIRRFDPLRGLPVIMVSGSDHEGDIARARACGASDYRVKPAELPLWEAFARDIAGWRPGLSRWAAKESVRISSDPLATSRSPHTLTVVTVPPAMSLAVAAANPFAPEVTALFINKEPAHVMIACAQANISLAVLTDKACREEVINTKRKHWARVMMQFGYGMREMRGYLDLSDAWFEKRRAEMKKSYGSRTVAAS